MFQLVQQREALPYILLPENQPESFFAPVLVPTNIPVLLYGEEMRGLGETCTVSGRVSATQTGSTGAGEVDGL